MEVPDILATLGGVATRASLISAASRSQVDRALRERSIIRVAHGRYALTAVDDARSRAHAVSGVLCLTSAALLHGWAVKTVPDRPHVVVPRRRKVTSAHRRSVQVHYRDLPGEEIVDGVTSKVATLRDCLRMLPFDEALAVADSALRAGEHSALRRAVSEIRGPGRAKALRVAALATADAANPFESVLRAIAAHVPRLRVRAQALITSTTPWCRPDLVDEDLRIVLEADSFQWHGDRAALARDARRYNLLVADGWLVLRFSWEDVMFHPDDVRQVLERVVRRAELGCHRCTAA